MQVNYSVFNVQYFPQTLFSLGINQMHLARCRKCKQRFMFIKYSVCWFQLPSSLPALARECPTAAVRKLFILARQQLRSWGSTVATLVHRPTLMLHPAGKSGCMCFIIMFQCELLRLPLF